MPIIAAGASGTPSLDVRNSNGDFVDPSNITLEIRDSLGDAIAGFPVVYPGTIVKDSVGQYHYSWTVPSGLAVGTYYAVWSAILLGSPEETQETWEVVGAGSLTAAGLDFLLKPDDYNAVRGLLGVTTLDVEDTDIEFTSFAPQAEMLVKRRISNWATQMTFPDQLFVLRLATIYQTACLMARSFVRGGTIGLVRPLSTGEGRDWAEIADGFCARYEYWVNIADDSDTDDADDSSFFIHPLRVGGPTSFRVARRRAGTVLTNGQPLDADWWVYPPLFRQ